MKIEVGTLTWPFLAHNAFNADALRHAVPFDPLILKDVVLYANFGYNFACSSARKPLSPARLDYLISVRRPPCPCRPCDVSAVTL